MPADQLSEGPGSKANQAKMGTLGAPLNVASGLTGVSANSAAQTVEDRVTPSGEGGSSGGGKSTKGQAVPGGQAENTDKDY